MEAILVFLRRLGERQVEPAQLVLLGGSALLLMGSRRATLDIDYVGDDLERTAFQDTIDRVAADLNVRVDAVPIGRLVPLPPDAAARQRSVGQFGAVEVYLIDPYVIALSKLDRGFDTDIADVAFLVEQGHVVLDRITALIVSAIPQAAEYDLDPAAMRRHLDIVQRRIGNSAVD